MQGRKRRVQRGCRRGELFAQRLEGTKEIMSEQSLSNEQRARLDPLKDGVVDVLNELERRLDKYQSLGT